MPYASLRRTRRWGNGAALLVFFLSSLQAVEDSTVAFSSYLGGGEWDSGDAIAISESGEIYITGSTSSVNFPTANAYQSTCSLGSLGSCSDAIVVKLDPTGTKLLYSTYYGYGGNEEGRDIAVDRQGNAYIAGYRDSAAIVAKFNPEGQLVWGSTIYGSPITIAHAIAVDESGNVYVAGETLSDRFKTNNALQPAPGAPSCYPAGGGQPALLDAFVIKYNADGSVAYSSYLGGDGNDIANDIAVDSAGNLYVVGETSSVNFPVVNAIQQQKRGGDPPQNPGQCPGDDAFIAKINPDGSALVYSTFLGGDRYDTATGVRVDAAGSVFVSGETRSMNFPASDAAQSSYGGGPSDVFVVKLNPMGNQLVYATFIGGSGTEYAGGVGLDFAGNAYIVGSTNSTDLPVVNAWQRSISPGMCGPSLCQDAFVAKLNPIGTSFSFSSYFGGSGEEYGRAAAVDPHGEVYVTGYTRSTDFPTRSALQAGKSGTLSVDAFFAKITQPSDLTTPLASLLAASYRGPEVAPESIVSVFGNRMTAVAEQAASLPLPATLAGASILVTDSEGVARTAPLFFASPGQMNYLLPAGTHSGDAQIAVIQGDRTVGTGVVRVEPVAPALFSANADGQGVAAAVFLRVGVDGSESIQLVFSEGAAGSRVPVPLDFGLESDQPYLLLFGTGIRGRSSLSAVTAEIGGEKADILYAGPQGEFVGLDQVNLRLPRILKGRGVTTILLTVDGRLTNPVTVQVK